MTHIPNPSRDLALSISYAPIETLKLKSNNPRRHDRKQIGKIAASINEFGFIVPVLSDAGDNVLAGHGRILAAKQLGYSDVPIIRIEHLSAAQAQAFIIADNRLCELGTWDERILAQQLQALSELALDFSLETTGFDMGEIDVRIQGLAAPCDDDDDVAAVPTGPVVSQPGDLWLLGPHRVLCADACDAAAYERLFQGGKAGMVFTDPPYNVKIDGHASGLGKTRHREFAMASGEMNQAQFTEFLSRALQQLTRHSQEGALLFCCMDWRHMPEILAAGRASNCELMNLCVWVKNNGGMGSFYRSQHELIFVFKSGAAHHRNNVQLGCHGRNRTNVWSYDGANDFGRGAGEGDLLALHPTPKPVKMVADAILDCTQRGDIVLDGFLGSGSTLIAAERTGRICYGIEIDPLHVDTVVRRWQAVTGGPATCALTGKRFADRHADTEKTNGKQ